MHGSALTRVGDTYIVIDCHMLCRFQLLY